MKIIFHAVRAENAYIDKADSSAATAWKKWFFIESQMKVEVSYRKSPTGVADEALIFHWCDVSSFQPVNRGRTRREHRRGDLNDFLWADCEVCEIVRWQLIACWNVLPIFKWNIRKTINPDSEGFFFVGQPLIVALYITKNAGKHFEGFCFIRRRNVRLIILQLKALESF